MSALRGRRSDVLDTPAKILAQRDLVYASPGGRALHLDLLKPEGAKEPLPVVMHIHGGGWFEGGRGWEPIRTLAAQGFAVADVEYRLTDEAKWPAQIEDVVAAVHWIKAHAGEHGLDAGRVGAWGHSAGGHLVALLGAHKEVRAVAALSPPTDLRDPNAWNDWPRGVLTRLFGKPEGGRREAEVAASPISSDLKGSAPTLIVHGDADDVVPLDQAQRYYAALKAAGVPTALLRLSDAGHDLGASAIGWDGIADLTARWMRRYLV